MGGISVELYEVLKYMFDVIEDGKDPLTEMPKSKIKLYCVRKGFESVYFTNPSERENWIKDNKPKICDRLTIEYLGNVAGRENVIKETNIDGDYRLLSINDGETYQVYNPKRSAEKNQYIWNKYYGDIRSMYNAIEENKKLSKTI